jgi:hypothetical protein
MMLAKKLSPDFLQTLGSLKKMLGYISFCHFTYSNHPFFTELGEQLHQPGSECSSTGSALFLPSFLPSLPAANYENVACFNSSLRKQLQRPHAAAAADAAAPMSSLQTLQLCDSLPSLTYSKGNTLKNSMFCMTAFSLPCSNSECARMSRFKREIYATESKGKERGRGTNTMRGTMETGEREGEGERERER